MTIWQESRESLFTALAPVPYLVALLPILSIAAEANALLFTFVLSLIAAFAYLLIKRGIGNFRSNLAMRKENTPDENGKYPDDDRWERFKKLSHDAHFAGGIEIDPITEYNSRSPYPYAVYALWGLVWSVGIFLLTGATLAWLAGGSSFEAVVEDPAIGSLLQSLPLGVLEMGGALFPLLGSLNTEVQVVIGGMVLATGFVFLTGARNLVIISDDVHRRALRFLVSKNPLVKNELANAFVLVIVYGVLLIVV